MSTRKPVPFLVAVAVMALLTIPAAQAQTSTFSVQAVATTGGHTSLNGTDGPNNGLSSASALSNPPGISYDNGYGFLYADAGASANANIGHLHVLADATATVQTATRIGNNRPNANAEAHYKDFITIRSSLPHGTPVELAFREDLTVTRVASGSYSGSVIPELRVGAYVSAPQWHVSGFNPSPTVVSPEVKVKARVGDRLEVSMKLRARSEALYFSSLGTNGALSIEASAQFQMDPGIYDVWLDYDSDQP